MIAAGTPLLSLVVRRQTIGVTLTELPLVLALFFLPPLTVAVIYTLASLITHTRQRLRPAKFWFNVARAAAGTSLAGLVLLALPPMRGVGPGTWGSPLRRGEHGHPGQPRQPWRRCITLAARLAGRPGGGPYRRAGAAHRGDQRRGRPGRPDPDPDHLVVAAAARRARRGVGPGLPVVRAVLPPAPHPDRAVRADPGDGATRAATAPCRTCCSAGSGSCMQAEYATLWLPAQGRHPEVLLTARVDDSGPARRRTDAGDALRERAVADSGGPSSVGPRLGDEPSCAPALARQRGQGRDRGAAALRLGGDRHAGGGQPARRRRPLHAAPTCGCCETVAAHAAVAVENSRLVDRLRLRRLPRRADRPAQPAAGHRRAGRGGQGPRAGRGGGACCSSTSTGCARSTSRWATPPATRCSPRSPTGCAACAPSAALVGRAGGDEFVVTLRLESADAALELAAELRDAAPRRRWTSTRSPSTSTPRSAWRCTPITAATPAILLQRADLAATAAKSARRTACSCSTPAWSPARLRRLGPGRRPAPGAGQRRAGGLLPAQGGAAGPARWSASSAWPAGSTRRTARSPRRTSWRWPSTPASSAGSPRWCSGRACAAAGTGRDAGQPLPVAVNLSARTLIDPHFPDRVAGAARPSTACRPQLLTLEITEDGVLGRAPTGRCRPCAGCATSASGWRWTTSAPATRRCPTCAGCRCTRSRSTARSCRAWRPTRATWRSSGRWSTCPGSSAWPWWPRAWRAS